MLPLNLSLLIFGGCWEVVHVSTNDTVYAWKQHRKGRFYDLVNSILNP